jgi:tetratricopeptide (TPR) repeat protein
MNVKLSLALSSLVVFFSGCTSLQVNSEFGSGREAYLAGKNDVALSYFQSTAQKDSAYTYYGYAFRQGIWSYVGRTEYAIGSFPQARQSLERALSLNRNEELARLYLGLTLVRSGDRQQGLKEMEGGMRAIYDQTEYLTQNFRFSLGQFWDPGREIRTAIQDNLAMLSSREVDVQTVLANGEWLGKRVEQEIDWARRDQIDDIFRDGAARPD